jgi:hypothetical protein
MLRHRANACRPKVRSGCDSDVHKKNRCVA